MRVLILEYDAILCDLIRLALQRNGFTPIVCRDPMFVCEEIKTYQPEAMILDSRLPIINGIDLLYLLKSENLLVNLYVVFLSSLGFSSIVKQAVDAGADDFMVKPVEMDSLLAKIGSHQKGRVKNLLSSEIVNT